MGAYPALNIRVPEQEDLLSKFAQLNQIRASQQAQQQNAAEAPLRMQALDQSVQQGQLQLGQAQRAEAEQAATRAWFADPKNHGSTVSAGADALLESGSISPQYYQTLKEADLKQRQAFATYDKTQLENADAAHKQLQGYYSAIQDMTPEQIVQNWPQIAQAANSVHGNTQFHLDPNQPMTKEQLQQFGPALGMQRAYLDEALAKRKKEADQKKADADAALAQTNAERGGTTELDKYTYDYLQSKGLPNTPANRQAAFKEYTKETKIEPAQIRSESYLQIPTQVYDPKTGQTVYATRKDAIGQIAPTSVEAQAPKETTKYFTSGKGGQQLTAFNTAIDHLQLLDGLARDLGNGDTQVFNKAAQSWAQATGNPAPTNFEAAKNAMSGEVAAALKASGATDTEIEKVDKTFDRAQSPGQLKGAIATYRTLLRSKASNLQKQYEQGMQARPNFGGSENNSTGPKDGDTKTNGAGDKITFKGGKWVLQ